MDILTDILTQSWLVLEQSAVYVLGGVLVAGLLKAFLPGDLVARHLGRGRVSGVAKAALLGAPLPLCSCGVAPAAAGLRSQGAGKGPTAAFLVATPETGPDSVAVTWSLLDPLMALVRPLAAVLSGIAAGLAVNLTDREQDTGRLDRGNENVGEARLNDLGIQDDTACCTGTPLESCCQGDCSCESGTAHPTPLQRLRTGLDYALTDLLPDIGWWFLGGVLLAGTLTAVIPDGFLEAHLGTGMGAKLVMLAAGIPLYVCATSSTPIAAALALKGLSPGAALVFLLSGPATNAASLAVVGRVLGRKATMAYLASLALAALLAGVLTDRLYTALGLDTAQWITGAQEEAPGLFFALVAAALPAYLLLFRLLRRQGDSCGGSCGEVGDGACAAPAGNTFGCACTASTAPMTTTEHTP